MKDMSIALIQGFLILFALLTLISADHTPRASNVREHVSEIELRYAVLR